MLRSLHQQRPQIRIAFFADVHLRFALTRVSSSRLQPRIAAHVAALAEAMRIFQRQQKRQPDQRAYALDLLPQCHLRITLLCQTLDALVVFHDVLAQRLNCLQQGFQCGLQFWTQAFGFLWIQVAHVAAAQSFPVTLGQPASRVSQRRPRAYQSSPRPNHRQIRLHAAVLHRIQQLRIDPGQPRQRLRIQTIVFLAALRDQPYLARIRHDHFMPQLAEQATDPGRMRPDFQCDPTARQRAEHLAHSLGSCPDSLLQPYLARFIQHPIPAPAITQVQPDGQLLRGKILRLPGCYGANLLPCRSPLSLALSSASITWEPTASRRRPAFSSHLFTTTITTQLSTTVDFLRTTAASRTPRWPVSGWECSGLVFPEGNKRWNIATAATPLCAPARQ